MRLYRAPLGLTLGKEEHQGQEKLFCGNDSLIQDCVEGEQHCRFFEDF